MRFMVLSIFLVSNLCFAQTHTATLRERLMARASQTPKSQKTTLIFDIPVTYNRRVSYWIDYYQTKGKAWFREWLEKAQVYMPLIQQELKDVGLPQDLAFMVMIESGFEAEVRSSAGAVGPWQFIASTGGRYGLRSAWWLDERRDLRKSTLAAIRYMRDLYKEFGSWYLVAASYNMGETGLRRQIQKYQSRDFWKLSREGALPKETMDYVPKILAAMLINKSPSLYGFEDVAKLDPLEYDLVMAPGGLELNELADYLGITRKALKDLNAELILGYIPRQIEKHPIRVPKGAVAIVSQYFAHLQNPRKYSLREQLPSSIVR